MEDIFNADYAHGKRVRKYFEIKTFMICMFQVIHYC